MMMTRLQDDILISREKQVHPNERRFKCCVIQYEQRFESGVSIRSSVTKVCGSLLALQSKECVKFLEKT